jgi:thioesterase domain-containing protein
MERYDPLIAPDAADWLDTDEGERIELVSAYHRCAKVKLPNPRLHATMHVAVENQVAMGDEVPVRRTVERLQAEGLDRHDAIHAVSSVLAEHMYDLVKTGSPATDPNTLYWAALEKLTAKEWRRAR